MKEASSYDLSREVRVFISSTFRDMDGERNYLVKTTFPQLRKRCSERGIEFTELDLRWGVTEEEAKQGKVIKICLGEIDRCRPSVPFFIGILGERYGWIPSLIQLEKHKEILDDFEWVEKDLKEEMSITEMEIQYAVLRNPQMKGKAFFFLRGSKNTPEEFMETKGSVAAGKLFRLKELLRKQNDFPVHDYFSNEELGKQVEGELWKVIEQHFPPVIDNDPLTRSRKEHATFARSRTTLYIGGEKYYQKLDEHFKCEDQPITTAGSGGMGKSALFANWLSHFREQHPDVFILQHYIGGAPDSTDYAQVIKRMMEEMKTEFELLDEIPSDTGKLKDALPIFFAKSGAKGKWILVLDALNQIEDRDNAKLLNWLPDFIPPYVRVYLSTTNGSTLEILQKRNWGTLNVEPLTFNDRRELISKYLKRYSKNLPIEALSRIALDKESENPLILKTLLDELRIFGKHEELDKRINYYIGTNSPEAFFDRVLERMETDYENDHAGMVGEILSLIYCARKGLSEKELLEITNIPPLYWSPLYIALENHLVSHCGLLNISHDFFRQAIESKYFPIAEKKKNTHQRISNYIILDKYGSRAFDELVYQLTYCENWDEVIKILTDFNYLMEKCKDNKLEGILNDYQLVFSKATENVKSELSVWYLFFRERMHILRRGEKEWPSYKILFQLAMEHADESLVTFGAENWLEAGLCGWYWLNRNQRFKKSQLRSYLSVFEGHTDTVYGGLETQENNFLSWSKDKTLRFWDKTGNLLVVLEGHTDSIKGAFETHDGNILSWSWDKTLRLWDKNGNSKVTLKGHSEAVNGALVTNNGNILSWSDDETLRLWDWNGTTLAEFIGHSNCVNGAFETKEGNILSWSDDNSLWLWDKSGYMISFFGGHKARVGGAIETKEGNILSWSQDKTLHLWSNRGNKLAVLIGHTGEVISAFETKEGNLLSWGDKTLRLWDKEGNLMVLFEGHSFVVTGALETREGNILSWSWDKTLRLWDKNGNSIATLIGHTEAIDGAIETNDGSILSWSWDKTLRLWDKNGNSIATLNGHTRMIDGAIETNNGNILSWSADSTLRLWNKKSKGTYTSLVKHSLPVQNILETNDGNVLSWSADKIIRLWDNKGIQLDELVGHTGVLNGVLETKDGEILSWSADKTLILWNKQGAKIAILAGPQSIYNVAFITKDGNILSYSTDTIKIFDKNGYELIHKRSSQHKIIETSEGNLLSWSFDKTLVLWDKNVNPIVTLVGHTDCVIDALETREGNILTWSEDNTLRLWDKNGNPMAILRGNTGHIFGTLETNEGYILSWAYDNPLRLWNKEGKLLCVFEGKCDIVDTALETQEGNILTWSKDKTLRLWDKLGNYIQSYSNEEGLRKFIEFRIEILGRANIQNNTTFQSNGKRGILTLYCAYSTVEIIWHSDSECKERYLKSDGSALLTQDNGEVCFLQLYYGNQAIPLAELEEKIKDN